MTLEDVPGAVASPVEWTFDPWSERPAIAGIAALAVLGMWLAIAGARLPLLIALGLGAFAAAPLLPAVIPAACRIGTEGAERRGLVVRQRRAWADVRRVEDVPIGVLLSPFTERSWLDTTRALALPMPVARRAELRALVRDRWRSHGGTAS
jgi:hypothetical protein